MLAPTHTYKVLSQRFGINLGSVSDIVRGLTYRDVPGPTINTKSAGETIRQKYGPDFFKRVGYIGGSNGTTGGFASEKVGKDGLTGRQRASIAGIKGGRIGKRRKRDDPRD